MANKDKMQKNRDQLLCEMALSAAKAGSGSFAQSALDGLKSMGFDPAAAIFPETVSCHDSEPKSYLEALCESREEVLPMLKTVLKNGADPEGRPSATRLGPLALAIRARSWERALALDEAGASWLKAELATGQSNQGEPAFALGWEKGGACAGELLLMESPWSSFNSTTKTGAVKAAQWTRLAGRAIEEASQDPKRLSALCAALAIGEAFNGNAAPAREVAQALAAAGADPVAPAPGVKQLPLQKGSACALELAAAVSGYTGDGSLPALCLAFPEQTKKKASDILAAYAAGLSERADEGDLSEDNCFEPIMEWDKKEIELLAALLASAQPSVLAKGPKNAPAVSFAFILGALCQSELAEEPVFEEALGFYKAIAKAAAKGGLACDAKAFGEELARGAALIGPIGGLEKGWSQRALSYPKNKASQAEAVIRRAMRVVKVDERLASQGARVRGLIASGWCAQSSVVGEHSMEYEGDSEVFAFFAKAALKIAMETESAKELGPLGLRACAANLADGVEKTIKRLDKIRKEYHQDEDEEFAQERRELEKMLLSLVSIGEPGESAPKKPTIRL